jgi:hypothetical protein
MSDIRIKPDAVDIEATLYTRSAHVRLPAGINPQALHDCPSYGPRYRPQKPKHCGGSIPCG